MGQKIVSSGGSLTGGIAVLVFGDPFQLKPVHGSYIRDTRHPESNSLMCHLS